MWHNIYIVTPSRNLFLSYCCDNDIDSSSANVIHVRHPVSVFGRVITPNDQIIYHKEHLFSRDDFKIITQEINRRKRGGYD